MSTKWFLRATSPFGLFWFAVSFYWTKLLLYPTLPMPLWNYQNFASPNLQSAGFIEQSVASLSCISFAIGLRNLTDFAWINVTIEYFLKSKSPTKLVKLVFKSLARLSYTCFTFLSVYSFGLLRFVSWSSVYKVRTFQTLWRIETHTKKFEGGSVLLNLKRCGIFCAKG